MQTNISEETINEAHERIQEFIHRTPVFHSKTLNQFSGAELYFKTENLQKVGAFKIRGAMNAVLSLQEQELKKGVTTHSSGNHAQALALAAKLKSIPSYIVMPENAPAVKKNAVADYGAEIIFCEATLQARESTVEEVIAKTGATFIHPYNDERIIAGQSTAAKELIEDVEGLDMIIAPVGGGGLLSGSSLSAEYYGNDIQVFGAEPEGADDAYRSLKEGHIIPSVNPDTIADGLLTSLGDKTFEIISNKVKDIFTVSDNEIINAMKLLWERMKLIVEPSGAVPLAAVLKNKAVFQHKRVGIIISGGNVDLSKVGNWFQ